MTTHPDPRDRRTLEAAADWLLRLHANPDDDRTHAAFVDWLSADPSHVEAWRRVGGSWQRLGDLAPGAGVSRASGRSAGRPRAVSRRGVAWSVLAVSALAACLLLAVGPGLRMAVTADQWTATAEARDVSLPDGSVVHLGGRSAIRVDMSAGSRSVDLVAGEAFFDVAPDAERPFIVTAGDVRVAVLGTAFDVRLSAQAVTVAVGRGTVSVEAAGWPAARLTAGQTVRVDRQRGAPVLGMVADGDVAAWREGYLFVERMTVAEVTGEIARYHPGWIVLADRDLAERRVTGLYNLRDPDAALRAVVEPVGGRITTVTGGVIVITGR